MSKKSRYEAYSKAVNKITDKKGTEKESVLSKLKQLKTKSKIIITGEA